MISETLDLSEEKNSDDLGSLIANILDRENSMRSGMVLVGVVVIFVLIAAVLILGFYSASLSQQLSTARANQDIYFYPQPDGGWKRSRVMPEERLEAFSAEFARLYFSWTPRNITHNLDRAIALTEATFHEKHLDEIKAFKKLAKDRRVTQNVTLVGDGSPKISYRQEGYVVRLKVQKMKAGRSKIYYEEQGYLTLAIVQTSTDNGDWGLLVSDYQEDFK